MNDDLRAEYDFTPGERGAVRPAPRSKTRITIRIDDEILEWFRRRVDESGGGNYQTLINRALREHITRHTEEELETTLRRVIREELRNRPSA